ncbi:MAG TPA: MBL fold metallo-hydrolase [Bryobacteraceae bacterium]|nr:MBL fold metallo-hydrolase [Bryobacteraceae bacterium]
MKLSTVFLIGAMLLSAQPRNLEIYWIDCEGGAATLIIAPDGQSLLADSGNPGSGDRDAKRIFEVAKNAGLKKIDYLWTTHYHSDHVGGAPALAKLIPIEHYLDHGDSVEMSESRGAQLFNAYKAVADGKRRTLSVGEKIPLKDVELTVVSSDGKVINRSGAINPFCQDAARKPDDTTENGRSAGFLLTFGRFKFLDLGDLTWDKEMELACPANRIGTVSLFQATHHGFYNDASGAPAHVWAIKPQVVLVNNGPRKGLHSGAWDTIQKIAGLEDTWQVHLALATDKAHNTTDERIANLEATDLCKGHFLKATVAPDGKFTITNGRTGYSRTYTAR